MWPEPLSADTTVLTKYDVLVQTRAGDGNPVARVLASHNPVARYAVFGEMTVIDPDGGPKQRVRALVLLVREALRYADAIGITRAHTDVPPKMLAFAQLLSGQSGEPAGAATRITTAIYEARTAALTVSDADGNLYGPMARLGDPIGNV